ncbi:MAG TPA: hypothetical protein VE733_00440 [Streptosporangiaceae bacterium]|jgi:hypothetical protein|nr:hypothetical protein [Streptosporangiaceae bacterium]
MRTALILSAARPAPHPPSPAVVLLWAVVIAVVLGAAYSISIRRHPYRPCRRCGESGKHRGTVFTRSFRACTRCGGTGRELRPFAKEPEARS